MAIVRFRALICMSVALTFSGSAGRVARAITPAAPAPICAGASKAISAQAVWKRDRKRGEFLQLSLSRPATTFTIADQPPRGFAATILRFGQSADGLTVDLRPDALDRPDFKGATGVNVYFAISCAKGNGTLNASIEFHTDALRPGVPARVTLYDN